MAKTALKKTDSEAKPKKARAPKVRRKKTAAEGTAATVAKACKVASCKREYRAKGYCASHYREWRNGKFGMARYKACSDMMCFKPMATNRHGFCEEHYQNYYVKGMEQAKVAAEAAPAKDEQKAAG